MNLFLAAGASSTDGPQMSACLPRRKRFVRGRLQTTIFVLRKALLVALAFSFSALSAAPTWHSERYGHYSRGEPLPELLQDFSASIGVAVVVSEKVKGKVSGNFSAVPAKKFLDELSRIYNFVWFYDGNTIFISGAEEMETRVVHLPHMSGQRIKRNLRSLGLWDGRYGFRLSEAGGVAYLSGPPHYVEFVAQAAELMDKSFKVDSEQSFVVRVFSLNHALAGDRTVEYRGEETVIPGVATILQSMVAQIGALPEQPGSKKTQLRSLTSARGAGLEGLTPDRGELEDAMGKEPTKGASASASDSLATEESKVPAATAFIYAEPRLNAVIIRALEKDIPAFAALIKKLDIPTLQVEIEVTIIDVTSSFIRNLGFEWQQTVAGASPAAGVAAGTYSTILTKSLGDFLLRVRALEETGNGNIVSKPVVMTLDNEEAVIDNSETFYVRLQGERDVDLVPVTVGSVLKVRPRVISQGGERHVYMDISIQDGRRQSGAAVDNIPGTSNTLITSQAIVKEQESLLLGGHTTESFSEMTHKVPLLGHIPLLGYLFTRKTVNKNKLTRMFVISPKIVDGKRRAHVNIPQTDSAQDVAAPRGQKAVAYRQEELTQISKVALQKKHEEPEATKQDASFASAGNNFAPLKGWAVQAGAFKKRSLAEKQLRALSSSSFPAKLTVVSARNGANYYRVYVGNNLSHLQAAKLRDTIREGFAPDAFIVKK